MQSKAAAKNAAKRRNKKGKGGGGGEGDDLDISAVSAAETGQASRPSSGPSAHSFGKHFASSLWLMTCSSCLVPLRPVPKGACHATAPVVQARSSRHEWSSERSNLRRHKHVRCGAHRSCAAHHGFDPATANIRSACKL